VGKKIHVGNFAISIGSNDCYDNSDEEKCPGIPFHGTSSVSQDCPANTFQCNDGVCILRYYNTIHLNLFTANF